MRKDLGYETSVEQTQQQIEESDLIRYQCDTEHTRFIGDKPCSIMHGDTKCHRK